MFGLAVGMVKMDGMVEVEAVEVDDLVSVDGSTYWDEVDVEASQLIGT